MKKARPTNPPAVSRERTLYLRRKRRRTHLVHACQIGFLVFFFAQWEISARLGWIDSFILSQPSRILETLRNMSQNHLMMHVGVTLYETLTGFVLGVLLGVAIAVVLWWSGFVSRVAEPYLVAVSYTHLDVYKRQMMAPVYKSRVASIMVLSRSRTFAISSSAVINLVRLATLRCSSAFCSNTTMPVSRLTK